MTPEQADGFAAIALGHVEREFPNHLSHTMAGPADWAAPRILHPVFFGSLDWHSCVHAYWMLARLRRRHPAMACAGDIDTLFARRLTEAAVAGECAYFQRPGARGFERPYGWAWLLMLAAELRHHPSWSDTLAPLARLIEARLHEFLGKATYPIRTGTHFNTAFALALAAEYTGPAILAATAERWYGTDVACQAWEPGGDEFLSSALIEAECMRRLLPPARFHPWFDAFLPGIAARQPATLFRPAAVSDRSDGKIAHLDGLNLSRAWCWRALAGALPDADPRRRIMEQAAAEHLHAGLPHLAEHYMGEHWLASFAVLALLA